MRVEARHNCPHCGRAPDDPVLFEGITDAQWEASRGDESSIMNANYFAREYRRQQWQARRDEQSLAVATGLPCEWRKP